MPESISITTPDGVFSAYLARPAAEVAPAVVVLQEIFGVNADMRATCDELAAQGFLAVCPDLFWRLEAGVELTDHSAEEWTKALALHDAFDVDTGVSDAALTLQAARALPGASGKAGALGFCLGGKLAFLTAVRTDCDASVSYYGGGIDKHVEEADDLAHPLLLHIALEDEFMPKDAQAVILRALGGNPQVEIHTYPGCWHAFARHGGKHYDAAAAHLANGRSLAFLRRHLR
jgi:carboxymethylenebutenolidase